jgi:hypothetical protein
MRAMGRIALIAAFFVVAGVALLGCGGGDKDDVAGATTTQDQTTLQGGTTAPDQTTLATASTTADAAQAEEPAETEVAGMPAEFPTDIPVHPGKVTAYEHTKVTDTTTVHQLTVKTASSFDEVIEWYKTKLPAGWSVGFIEVDDGEAKIALNGGDYAPASPDGRGGGVIIGILEGDTIEIVTTATVMAP